MIPGSRRVLKLTETPGGFTLLEVAVAALLLSLVVAGVAPLVVTGDQVYGEAWRQQEMVRNARVVLDQIAVDFRRAVAVHRASGGVLRFDLTDGSGVRTVEYVLRPDGDLTYQVTPGSPQPLAGPFRSFEMACYDAQGATLSCADPLSLASVRQLEVRLEAGDPDPDPVRGPLPGVRLWTRVARRIDP